MSIFLRLSTLALRGLFDLDLGDAAAGFADRFRDQSRRLEAALRQANGRAWNALEVALGGETLWRRMTAVFVRAEDRAFAEQVRRFLDATPLPPVADEGYFRVRCLDELRQARPLLVEGRFDHAELARQASPFAGFREPHALLDAEWAVCVALADDVRRLGLERLAWLLEQRPKAGPPLLVTAVRFFFRRAVEEDGELFRGLTFAKLEAAAEAQHVGLEALAAVHASVAGLHERLDLLFARLERGPAWLVDAAEFAEQTHRYWLSGRADGIGPSYRVIATRQPKAEFLAQIGAMARLIGEGGFPYFRDEALIGGGRTMALTTYRMLITTPQRRLLCLPLADVESYTFEGAEGTVLGFFAGSEVRVSGRFGRHRWRGEELAGLEFPTAEAVRGARERAEWRGLPEGALGRMRGEPAT